MLVLKRENQQTITIGPDIEVTVVRIDRYKVRLAIKAPKDVKIMRKELELEGPTKEGEGK